MYVKPASVKIFRAAAESKSAICFALALRLGSIHFEDESRLNFTAETQRTHHEGIPLLARSDYQAPFGTFTGSLNGLPIASALGVMEAHDAIW